MVKINFPRNITKRPAAQKHGLARERDLAHWGHIMSVIAENDELRGQKYLIENPVLPYKIAPTVKIALEAAGVKFGKTLADNKLLQEAVLPKGWKKVATEKPMWTELVDNKGKVRASIFYKVGGDAFINY